MGITTSAQLTNAINDYYVKKYLENFFNENRMYAEADKTDLPQSMGSVARWNRMSNIGMGSVISTVGTPPSATALETTYMTAKLIQFGKLVEIADDLHEDAVQGTVEEAMIQLSESAKDTIDDFIVRACFGNLHMDEKLSAQAMSAGLMASPSNVKTGVGQLSGTYLGYSHTTLTSGLPRYLTSAFPASAAMSALATLDTEYPVRITDLRYAANILKKKNVAPKSDGYYHFVCNSGVATGLMNQDGWATWNAYTREGQLKAERGEFGIIGKVKLIESNNMFASTVGITGTPSYTLNYSILLGKGAIGVTEHSGTGKNAQGYEIHRVGRKADKADPLGQYSTAGYKLRLGSVVTNPSAGLILISYQA